MSLTPEQFNKLTTKEDLVALESRLEEKFATKEDFRGIVDTLDYIVKKLDKIDTEQTANIAAHDRMDEAISKIQNSHQELDLRVQKLEGSTV